MNRIIMSNKFPTKKNKILIIGEYVKMFPLYKSHYIIIASLLPLHKVLLCTYKILVIIPVCPINSFCIAFNSIEYTPILKLCNPKYKKSLLLSNKRQLIPFIKLEVCSISY